MRGPVWESKVKDGSNGKYTLKVMPRTKFEDLPSQTGIRITGPLLEMTVGLPDVEVRGLIAALERQIA